MKLYQCIKGDLEKTVKILGLPIMERYCDHLHTQWHKSYFGGIVTKTKKRVPFSDACTKETLILGKSIFKRTTDNDGCKYYYILGKKVYSVSLIKKFKKRYFKYFDKEYDDIYILRSRSGEAYITLTYIINALIKKNHSQRPLLVTWFKYHLDMIKMICPEIPCILIPEKINWDGDSLVIDNFRFFMLYSGNYYRSLLHGTIFNESGQYHYFKYILSRLNLTENDIQINKTSVLPEAEKSMLEKISQTGLNLEKFVILAPEAETCDLYDDKFWILLIKEFQNRGYDVFVNLVKSDISLEGATDYKVCNLTFPEIFALAQKSKKIVSLRSGLTEFLLQTGVPIDALYTPVSGIWDAEHVISEYGLLQLPFVDKSKIHEFNMTRINFQECIAQILNTIK